MKGSLRTQNGEHGNIQSSLNYFLKFNLPKDVKILDIGCNYGSLIYNLSKKGYKNVYGIDVNKKSIELGKREYKELSKRINFYEGKQIPFKDNSFDVVLMFDVIEHIPNVEDFLKKQVYRILKRGGKLIFQTPNKIINIPWEIINNKSFTKWKEYHCSLQTKGSLKKLLEEATFKKIIIEKYNLLTKHNKSLIENKLGVCGLILLYIVSILPLSISSNFWGSCEK